MSLKNLPYLGSRDDYISVRISLFATCRGPQGVDAHCHHCCERRAEASLPTHKPVAQPKRQALPSTSLWQSALPSLSGNVLERYTQIAALLFY